MPFARVLVDRAAGHAFDYSVPEPWARTLGVGFRVRVPVRGRSELGTVIEMLDRTEHDGIKPIAAVLGDRPTVRPQLLDLARWMASYYCCPVETALRGILPQVIRNARVGHKRQRIARIARPPAPDDLAALEARAKKQHAVLAFLLAAPGPMPVSALARECGVGPASVEALAEKGWIAIEECTVVRDPHGSDRFVPNAPIPLNPEQRAALDLTLAMIAAPAGERCPVLLHGVTGSGKTEVYLQAIQAVLDLGKSAILLIPEIALTPQTVERIKSRFASLDTRVAVLHSHLSEGERHDEWHKINDGHARIVVGARSAVFAPVADLGLIVVDEEHEPSYKQEDAPRYHARDLAVVRAKAENCAVLLGSATPSIESFHNAATGKYRLATLAARADDRRMPVIRIVDMRQEARKAKAPALLSERLVTAIKARLERKEQSILFLNRRGFSTSLLCSQCGFVKRCEHCSVAMTFHRNASILLCHLCGHREVLPRECPDCRDPGIRYSGAGTEKVEELVAKIFAPATVRRMDADTMTRKDAYRETLDAFRRGKIDILVGTQMIAKGLHFPNVTLVGIINADLALHLPDFRAAERTFQLLTQVAGRAGRGDVEGEVFVQSSTPFHPAIQFARHHDFSGFFEQETEFRKAWDYPPFTHMALIGVRSPHQGRAELTAQTIGRRLSEGLPAGAALCGVAPAPLERSRGQWRYQVTLKARAIFRLSRHIAEVLAKLPLPEDVIASVDVDPYQLL